jgi:hypothetical protein
LPPVIGGLEPGATACRGTGRADPGRRRDAPLPASCSAPPRSGPASPLRGERERGDRCARQGVPGRERLQNRTGLSLNPLLHLVSYDRPEGQSGLRYHILGARPGAPRTTIDTRVANPGTRLEPAARNGARLDPTGTQGEIPCLTQSAPHGTRRRSVDPDARCGAGRCGNGRQEVMLGAS